MTVIVMNLGQLREALRVAEQLDTELDAAEPGDSVQIHLRHPEEGMVEVNLWSQACGEPKATYTVDYGSSPGETGVAKQAPLSSH